MEFRLLGPLLVESAGTDVAPTRPKQRALLAILLLRANEAVSVDELIDALWHLHVPATAATALQGHVSALRRRLGAERIRTGSGAYALQLAGDDAVDVQQLERLLAEAAGQDEPEDRAATLSRALALFRGPPLVEFRYEPFAEAEARRLEELQAVTRERRAEALIEAGEHRSVLGDLEALAREHPLRERAGELLMLALYRSGRQADALDVGRSIRTTLAGELGVEVGPALQRLERQILDHDPRLLGGGSGAGAPARRTGLPSRLVTFLVLADARDEVLADARERIERRGGIPVGETPSGAEAFAFARVLDAADAAANLVRRTARDGTSAAPRIGIGTFEVVPGDPTYSLAGVRRTGHVAFAAHRGQVLLSRSSRDLLLESAEADVALEDLGEERLLDLGPPQRVFRLASLGLPSDFPPPRAVDRLTTNLPVLAEPLIGREREIREVVAALQRSDVGIVTLTGPGGTGKTRLALHIAAEAHPCFPGGAHLVELAAIRTPEFLLPAIASVLGLNEEASTALEEVIARQVRRPTLLVIDNFEQLLPAAPRLAALGAAAPALRFLVTSRAALSTADERVYEVAPLAAPAASDDVRDVLAADSVALFTARARAARPDLALGAENAHSVAVICRALDGLPLAIELAAARMTTLSLEDLARRFASGLGILSSGRPATSDRHRTLEAAIAWSSDLLDEGSRALFRRLSVFAGGASLAAVEAICGGPAVIDRLSSLVDHSLVRSLGPDPSPRFAMLETIREFAARKLVHAAEARDYDRRHALYFLELAELAEPHLRGNPGAWLRRLEQEHDNIRAALDRMAEAGEHELEIGFAGALWRFWYLAGHLTEGRRRIERALNGWPPADAARGRALLGAAVMAVNAGDANSALARSGEALEVHRAIGDAWGVAYARFMLAAAERQHGRVARSRELNEIALVEFRRLGDEHSALLVARNLAGAYEELGDRARARSLYEDNLRRARATDNPRLEASSLGALASLAHDEGRLQDGAWLLGESLRIHQTLDDQLDTAVDLSRAARLLVVAGRPETATQMVACLGQVARDIGVRAEAVNEMNEETVLAARRQLDEPAFAAAWSAGKALSLGEATLLALEALPAAREP